MSWAFASVVTVTVGGLVAWRWWLAHVAAKHETLLKSAADKMQTVDVFVARADDFERRLHTLELDKGFRR